MTKEEIFERNANSMMSFFMIKGFKRTFKTLYAVIMKSMEDYSKTQMEDYLKEQYNQHKSAGTDGK